MVFTSFDYALLLAMTVLAFWSVPARGAYAVLLVSSVVFYAYWSVPYLALFGLAIGIGFAAAAMLGPGLAPPGKPSSIELPRRRRAWLVAAVAVLLGLLAYFKYANFIIDTVMFLSRGTHEAREIALPLAISFYTFQIVGYVVDVYRGSAAERSPSRFALFVLFFPQLIAGPICRAHELLPQLVTRKPFDPSRFLLGLELVAYGVLKKTVVADNLAVLVDRVYTDPATAGGIDIALATLAFGGQIYCDFSGYTDIARGSSRMLGIELPINFRSPYIASSLTDFWRRWHITLSSWLRDYLYIPLGGNRVRRGHVYANILCTMGLGGLWHGASVTFVLWGLYHGTLLVAERMSGRSNAPTTTLGRLSGMVSTFVAVQIGWAIFRAESYETLSMLATRVLEDPFGSDPMLRAVTYVPLIAAAYVLHAGSAFVRARHPSAGILTSPLVAAPALAAAILLVTVFGGASSAFIYFQF